MRPYHCYFLDAHGLIVDSRVLVCTDDHEVSELVPGLLAQRPQHAGIEVWQRSRRIGVTTADPKHA